MSCCQAYILHQTNPNPLGKYPVLIPFPLHEFGLHKQRQYIFILTAFKARKFKYLRR